MGYECEGPAEVPGAEVLENLGASLKTAFISHTPRMGSEFLSRFSEGSNNTKKIVESLDVQRDHS